MQRKDTRVVLVSVYSLQNWCSFTGSIKSIGDNKMKKLYWY